MVRTDQFNFQVIYTPGHSPDHICLYEPDQGWLFSGDLFIGGQDRALGAHNDIWLVIDSLKKVADLPMKQLFPGCARVRENPQDELHEKINYLEEMGKKVLELGQKGWDVDAIVCSLFGKVMFIEIFTLGHFSRHNLVKSYLSRVKFDN